MLKMPRLAPGDSVAIVAPASPVHSERLMAGAKVIEEKGYNIIWGRHVQGRSGFFSAGDSLRLKDFEDAWCSQAKAIFCARGGYGSQRLLSCLDWPVMTSFGPKWLVGYSDVTAFHNALTQRGVASLHGPVVEEFADASHSSDVAELFRMLSEGAPGSVTNSPAQHAYTLVSGEVEGQVVGGNLTLLCATLGTPFEVETSQSILLFEDVGEAPYRIDRMLSSLALAGKLQAAAGFIVGTFSDCEPRADGVTVDQVLADWLTPLGKPTVVGMPIGHGEWNHPVVISSWGRLLADQLELEFWWDLV